ncbi:MAG TPA: PP2C family protein-serine/threonine phosphatase [Jatrophihabitans sp.]|nr:PP2C family protein-serine/threonine phosphatase [Jatrophihabitans sp.]
MTRPAPGDPVEQRLLATARRRSTLLSEVSSVMAGSLNIRRSVLRLLDILQPDFADWVMLGLLDSSAARFDLYGGADPRNLADVSAAQVSSFPALQSMMITGETELLHVALAGEQAPRLEPDGLDQLIPHPQLREEAKQLRPADALGLALLTRGTIIGFLVLLRSEGRGFTVRDIGAAEEIARRAALSLDSARIYRARMELTSALQGALRPPALPNASGLRLAATYRAAAEHLDIGGDFYDAFTTDDELALVCGSVRGPGISAAPAAIQVRQSVRTAARFSRRPDSVLGATADALHLEVPDVEVNLCYARVQLSPGGGHATIDVGRSGGVPPVLITAAGSATAVEFPELAVSSYARVEVERADMLLLLSSGIVDSVGPSGRYGLDRVLALAHRYAGTSALILAEALEQDVVDFLDGKPHDDLMALVVECGP